MEFRDRIDEELERVCNKMKSATPGTEQYVQLLTEAERLAKLIGNEDRLELEKLDSQAKRDLDEDKQRLAEAESERNYELAKEQAKAEAATAANNREVTEKDSKRGIVKSLIGAGAMLAMGVLTIYSEESRIITSKAWSFVSKIAPKI